MLNMLIKELTSKKSKDEKKKEDKLTCVIMIIQINTVEKCPSK